MRAFTDLSQLTKSMVKKPVEEPKPAPKPKAEKPTADREAAELLAHLAQPLQDARERPRGRSGAGRSRCPVWGEEANVRASGGERREVAAFRRRSSPDLRPDPPKWAVGPPE